MIRFETDHELWLDGQKFEAGEHESDDPAVVRLASHAACGSDFVRVLEGGDFSDIESQEDSERAYADAQADGRWQEGNLQDFAATEAAKAATLGGEE